MTGNGRRSGTAMQIRYAYLRSDGTGYIVAGSAIAGLAAYAYQFLGGRTLGAERFAPVSVLLTIHFLTFIVFLLPIEQLLVRRLTINRGARLPAAARWLAAATIAGATLFSLVGVDEYLNGDRRFIVFTGLTVATHSLFASGRGRLAGRRRFSAYGMASGSASMLRLAIALVVTVIHPSASGFALGLILGPLVVLLWRPFRRADVASETQDRSHLNDRGLLTGLVLAAAASQALLLSGPIVVGLLGGTAVQISVTFAAFTLARAPLVFGYNLLARVLPPFTSMALRGERQELRAWAQGMTWAALGLGVVAAALGWMLGPWSVGVAFGPEFVPDRLAAAIISAGVVLSGAGLFVGQTLLAQGRSAQLALAWLAGLLAAAASIVPTTSLDAVARVSLGFTVGEIVALGILVSSAVRLAEPERRRLRSSYHLAKRTLDIAVALFLLVLSIPLILLAGIVVRLDSRGPIFLRQTRIGEQGTPFGLFKIRTMHTEADEEVLTEHLARLKASRHSENAPPLRIEGDFRITRVGAILRRWSIDELPNLWNVLRGHLSLVGPRPLVPDEAEMIGLNHPRFTVKPGITGLAQVGGRDTITLVERLRLDVEYVQDRSIRLDLFILFRTLRTVFREPGDEPDAITTGSDT